MASVNKIKNEVQSKFQDTEGKIAFAALDTDASAEAAKAGDLACERYVLAQGKLQVEVLDNLDRVAPAGALILVCWPRIAGATGLPVRAVAITPKQ